MAVAIPLFRPGQDVTAQTTANVVGKTFVAVSGPIVAGSPAGGTSATLLRVATAAAGTKAVGVAAFDAASGDRVSVIAGPGHVVPVTSGAAVTAGAEVEVGTNGRAITLAAGKAVGQAWSTTTGADQELFVDLY